MWRTAFAASLLAMLACGAEQSDQGNTSSAGDTPPVSAAAPASKAMADTGPVEIDEVEVEEIEIETAPQVSSCLGLVGSGAFARAVPVCLEAAAIDPDNAKVQAALVKAQAEAAAGGAAASAANAASGAAAGQAAGAADAASGAAANALGGLGD